MSNIYEFQGIKPVIAKSSFVHPNATIIGDVIIGEDVYVGPYATLRGDWGQIIIEDNKPILDKASKRLEQLLDLYENTIINN